MTTYRKEIAADLSRVSIYYPIESPDTPQKPFPSMSSLFSIEDTYRITKKARTFLIKYTFYLLFIQFVIRYM